MAFEGELLALMEEALAQAREAGETGDVPVGAVVARDGRILGRGRNRRLGGDPLAHAEIEALRDAARALGSWRLDGCDLVVTLEPCPMCAGAIMQSRIARLFFGAFDPRAGCCGSLYNLPEDKRFPVRTQVFGGFMQEECAGLLAEFFRKRRENR